MPDLPRIPVCQSDGQCTPVLELLHAAQALHDEYAEYGLINNLGGYDNHNMRRIRAAIEAAWRNPQGRMRS